MDDPFASIRDHISDVKAQWEEHRRSQHTRQYEEYLSHLPERPWTPTRRLQISRCDICQALFELIVDGCALLPSDHFVIDAMGGQGGITHDGQM